MNGKLCVFDFDGTLSSGFISMGFMDYLHEAGIYSDEYYASQKHIFDQYKKNAMAYDVWCDEWGKLWTGAFMGKPISEVRSAAKTFFNSFRKNIYASSYDLVKLVKSFGYAPILVSVGSYEAISLAAEALGIERIYATRLEVADGICTGRAAMNLYIAGEKGRVIDRLSKEFSLTESIGFGDSISDVEILDKMDMKIALNPSKELRAYAEEHDYMVASYSDVLDKISARLGKKLKI